MARFFPHPLPLPWWCIVDVNFLIILWRDSSARLPEPRLSWVAPPKNRWSSHSFTRSSHSYALSGCAFTDFLWPNMDKVLVAVSYFFCIHATTGDGASLWANVKVTENLLVWLVGGILTVILEGEKTEICGADKESFDGSWWMREWKLDELFKQRQWSSVKWNLTTEWRSRKEEEAEKKLWS